jgi:hypothetical protein
MPGSVPKIRITSTLSFRLYLVLLLSVLFLFAGYSTLTNELQSRAMEDQLRDGASRAGDMIRHSVFTSMLLNERDLTHSIISLLGTEPDVDAVRIYNKDGRIMFSNDSAEIGTTYRSAHAGTVAVVRTGGRKSGPGPHHSRQE